jgi:uncharacterized membrane protein YebE (DUF533 family)
MVDYRKLLDAVVGAIGNPNQSQNRQGGSQGAHGNKPPVAGGASGQLLQQAKDLALQNPRLTQAALAGLAGLLFKGRKTGKLTGGLVKLGGLAVIGGLAYKAFQNRQPGASDNAGSPGAGPLAAGSVGVESDALSIPETSRFHPVSQTEDDALLFLRTMVAAAASDGNIDATERARIVRGLTEAGIDPDASRWLETEMPSPADVEELAAAVNDPDKAAQVYAAARIAIDPDTLQEREFLNQLATALDLDPAMRAQIDDTASAIGEPTG